MYGVRIIQAKTFPNDVLSAAIDGSDASLWGLPHHKDKTHDSEKGHKIVTKIYTAILHGHWAATYVFNAHLPGGTNVTVFRL
jgi:hypothetical protein